VNDKLTNSKQFLMARRGLEQLNTGVCIGILIVSVEMHVVIQRCTCGLSCGHVVSIWSGFCVNNMEVINST